MLNIGIKLLVQRKLLYPFQSKSFDTFEVFRFSPSLPSGIPPASTLIQGSRPIDRDFVLAFPLDTGCFCSTARARGRLPSCSHRVLPRRTPKASIFFSSKISLYWPRWSVASGNSASARSQWSKCGSFLSFSTRTLRSIWGVLKVIWISQIASSVFIFLWWERLCPLVGD